MELYALVFGFASDDRRTAEEVYQQVSTAPQSREDFCWQERWAALEDDDTTMMSFLVAKPMPIHFDGQHLTMTGVGGVATLPPYRRQGCIRACFEAALPDMYENGIAFSYLFPFSTAYYRKFGYEIGNERIRYQLQLAALPSYPVSGNCRLAEPGNLMAEEIRAVYRNWQVRYNLMVENEDFEFAWIHQSNPVKDQTFTYVYQDAAGQAKGFMTFTTVRGNQASELTCSRFFFTDSEGLQGLLSLAKSFASTHQTILFDLPTDRNIIPLLPEWSLGAAKRETHFQGMVRVVHAEKVLLAARYRGSGKLVLSLSDPLIPQNNKHFSIAFQEGRATELSVTDAPPDISLDIGEFSRLITGAFHPDMLAFIPTLPPHMDWDIFHKIFYPKPCYITESF